MGAGHAQTNAIGEEEDARAGVIKLPAIVTLKALHIGVKLCAHIGKEIRQVEKVSDLSRRGKVHK